MNTKLERNLKLMRLQSIFIEPLFWGPILILTLQKLAHMRLEDIYLQEAVCVLIMLVIDIPTGALADIIGRKKMLVIGTLFGLADIVLFAAMSAPWHAWLANILWAIGAAFRSGADKALIQESYLALGWDRVYYRKFIGSTTGFRFLLAGICAPITSYLGEHDLRLPLFLCIPFMFIPAITSFMLTEPPREEQKKLNASEHVAKMKEGFRDTYVDKRILWIMFYMSVIGISSKIWFFSYNPYFERVSIPVRYFGWIFLALNIVAWLASNYGHKIERKIGDKMTVHLLIPLIGIPVIVMSLFPIPAMALLVLFQNVARGMSNPFFDSLSSQYLRNSTRATVLSVQSSAISAAASLSLLCFGIMLKSIDLLPALLVLGILTMAAHAMLMRSWHRHFGN